MSVLGLFALCWVSAQEQPKMAQDEVLGLLSSQNEGVNTDVVLIEEGR